MTLIADSGATKTDWAFLHGDSAPLFFSSAGCNPNFISAGEIQEDIRNSLPPGFGISSVKEIHFYGSGVSGDFRDLMRDTLREVFPEAGDVFVGSDLLAAARALLGDGPGFAAILGTGMNTCIYDGREMTEHIAPLGFILGDEGSAAYIGKLLLRDYVRGNMPPDIREEVAALVGTDEDGIIGQIYRKPQPNRYCAGFCKWAGEHRHSSTYCNSLLKNAFRDFFRNVVSLYPDHRRYTFNCAGSVGFCNRDLLCEVAGEFGMRPGIFLKSPIDGLTGYHREHSSR